MLLRDVAKQIGCDTSTLRHAIRRGTLKATQQTDATGRIYHEVTQEDFDHWKNNHYKPKEGWKKGIKRQGK